MLENIDDFIEVDDDFSLIDDGFDDGFDDEFDEEIEKEIEEQVKHQEKLLEILECLNGQLDNKVETTNGALVYSGLGSALAEFNASANELRFASPEKLFTKLDKAFREDPLKCLKLIFETGDIRGGKGERKVFNDSMDWLETNHPDLLMAVLELIPDYTRWDYLVRLTVAANQAVAARATELVARQFREDLEALTANEEANISLLGKWLPSLQTKRNDHKLIVKHLLSSLSLSEREYRKALSFLRGRLNIIEKYMSAGENEKIEMEKLSSKQQLRYSAYLKRVLADKRHEYIQAVLRGEAKLNASVLNPVEIIHAYLENGYRYNEDYEAIWKLLPNLVGDNGNTLVIRDGSGSMTSHMPGTRTSMLDAADALTIYTAERLNGPLKNNFITFSSRPKLVSFDEEDNLFTKIRKLHCFNDCSNTDLKATFDLLLEAAVKGKLSSDQLPNYLLILSDMEFDDCHTECYEKDFNKDTLFDCIRKQWEEAGYELPTLVFWQLNCQRTLYPEIDSKNGIIYLSGFSVNELANVMAGKFENYEEVEEEVTELDESGQEVTVSKMVTKRVVLSPMEQLDLKLSNHRYDRVEEAVRPVLSRQAS